MRRAYAAPLMALAGLLLSACLSPAALADPPTLAGADAAFAQGKFDGARKTYESLVKADPAQAAPRLGLIQTLLRMDRWRDALREAQAATVAAPLSADARGLLALSEMRAGEPVTAGLDAGRALALDKDNYWGLVASGQVADWNGQDEESRASFTRAATLHPERPEGWNGLMSQGDENHYDEAEIAATQRYLALNPKGYPFDDETPFLRNFVDNELGYWRGFEKDPPFRREDPEDKEGRQSAYTAVFPIERDGDSVLVLVQINGKPFRLLFDTGAESGLMLSPKPARRLGLGDGTPSFVSGVQGRASARLQRVETLTLGSLTLHSIPLTVADSGEGGGDGIFGGTLLRDYAVTLDFDNGTMTLARGPGAAHMARPHTTTSTLPLHLYHGDLMISGHAREQSAGAPDHPFWAVLDTGADADIFSLALTHDLAAGERREDWREGSFDARSGIGDSARRVDYCLTLTKTRITFDGSTHVLNQIGLNGESIMDRQVSPGADFETGMLLGIPVLAQHSRVTIDYPHRLLTFEDPDAAEGAK